MSEDSRGYRRVKATLSVFYKRISDGEYSKYKRDVEGGADYTDSFDYLMSENNLDSSYGSLNRAFVLIMKSLDAKLNYIIDLLKNVEKQENFRSFKVAESCDLSASGISIRTSDSSLSRDDKLFMVFSLPIASHVEIKTIGSVVTKREDLSEFCYGINFLEINRNHMELLIHYSLFLERSMIKQRMLEE